MKKFREIRKIENIVSQNEAHCPDDDDEEEMDEASYVASDGDILDSIWKEVRKSLVKDLKRGNTERVNMMARLGKFKVTKSGQQKGRTFRYDLKR
tara:strand:+ start:258 stop:542 length:285 start_codon:yes stop_codon:yes gene_type:complete